MGSHLMNGQFQSDKYPATPTGFVPLKCTDKDAQDLLWTYAQRHRARDPEFSADLEQALKNGGYKPTLADRKKRQMDSERHVIVGLTSTAARLIGLCVRDKTESDLDKAADKLDLAIDALESFGGVAGCDSGTEYTTIAIKQIVGWLRARDYDAASKALHERYDLSRQPDGFYISIAEAMTQQGYRP